MCPYELTEERRKKAATRAKEIAEEKIYMEKAREYRPERKPPDEAFIAFISLLFCAGATILYIFGVDKIVTFGARAWAVALIAGILFSAVAGVVRMIKK